MSNELELGAKHSDLNSPSKNDTPENIEKVLKAAWALALALNRTVDKGLPKKLANIVKTHAVGAAIGAGLVAWVPGVGPIIGVAIAAFSIWVMYFRINKAIALPTVSNLFKTLAAGASTNFMSYLVGIVVSTLLSFTGIGNIVSDIIMVFVCYGTVLGSGILYLKILANIFQTCKDPVTISLTDLEVLVEEVKAHKNIKPCISDATMFIKEKTAATKAAINAEISEIVCESSTDSQKKLKSD